VTFAAFVNAHNNTAVAMLLHSGPCGPFIFPTFFFPFKMEKWKRL